MVKNKSGTLWSGSGVSAQSIYASEPPAPILCSSLILKAQRHAPVGIKYLIITTLCVKIITMLIKGGRFVCKEIKNGVQ